MKFPSCAVLLRIQRHAWQCEWQLGRSTVFFESVRTFASFNQTSHILKYLFQILSVHEFQALASQALYIGPFWPVTNSVTRPRNAPTQGGSRPPSSRHVREPVTRGGSPRSSLEKAEMESLRADVTKLAQRVKQVATTFFFVRRCFFFPLGQPVLCWSMLSIGKWFDTIFIYIKSIIYYFYVSIISYHTWVVESERVYGHEYWSPDRHHKTAFRCTWGACRSWQWVLGSIHSNMSNDFHKCPLI